MRYFLENRFLIFLFFLISLICVTPFFSNPKISELFLTLNYTFLLLSGLYAFSTEKRFFRYSAILFIISIFLDWFYYFGALSNFIEPIQPLLTSIILVLLLVMTLRSIYNSQEIDHNVIFGVLSGYVLLGYFGAFVAVAISRTYPGAFNISTAINVSGTLEGMDAIYFSFITMTTLGYGDITPSIPTARSLAILLSILGPMYVAIVVALMVGKFAARGKPEK